MLHKKKKPSVSICRFLLLFLVLVFPIEQALAVIYGDDNRLDPYECTDQELKDLAYNSAVVLVEASNITCSDGNCTPVMLQSLADWYLSEDPLDSGNPICSDERFIDQPTLGFCSGILIDDNLNLIVTAGHCIENQSDCQNTAFVFNYQMADANTPITTFPESDVYYGQEIVAHSEDESGTRTEDWTIVRVDRDIVDHEALPVRTAGIIEEGDPVVTIVHQAGLPVKIEDGGWVQDDPSPGSPYFVAPLDTYGGNSGSAVFSDDGSRRELIGILVRGEPDFETDPNNSCDKAIRCPDSGCPGWEKVIRSTEFADYVPYDYIVVFTDQLSKDNAVASATFPILHDYNIIPGFAAHLDYQDKEQLLTDPNVVYIEPDMPVYISELSTQSSPGGGVGEIIPDGVSMVNAPAVWPTTTGEGAVVCVLDTGMDVNHPDRGAIAPGWNFIDDNSDINDGDGHGTHVSGTIAAAMGNGIGVAGIAPDAIIMPVRFLGPNGGCVSDEIAGIEYAAANGARVINASFGTYGFAQSEYDALNSAAASGVLLVAAAGDANDVSSQSQYDLDNIISVAWSDTPGDTVNWGPTIDIAAPGTDIISTANGAYEYRSGTDMAAAHVSGVAALLFAWGGTSMSAPQVRMAIEQTADDLGSPGRDDYYGHGLVNAEKALAFLLAEGVPTNCAEVHDFGYSRLADLNNDCYVSLLDLQLFALEWLNNCDDGNQWCNAANFDGSGMVSFANFATFCQQWLECNDPQELNCSPCIPNWPTP
jgi:V8-like Glu-specific endopeptidase